MAMNCDKELIATGGATRVLQNVLKEPDESFRPRSKRNITFAVEAGVSKSPCALETDAKIWLENSESHVTQVMTIKISRARAEVYFTLFIEAPQREGHKSRTLRASI